MPEQKSERTGRMLVTFPVGQAKFVPNKKAGEDKVGHGTHCAGLIAGAQR